MTIEQENEQEYENILKSCVKKDTPHIKLEDDCTKYVYTITTIAKSNKYGGQRTPIVCSSFEYAVEVVSENNGDIWETTYNLAVIESVLIDCLYGSSYGERYWYIWERNGEDTYDGQYVPIEEPEPFKNTYGYGIG